MVMKEKEDFCFTQVSPTEMIGNKEEGVQIESSIFGVTPERTQGKADTSELLGRTIQQGISSKTIRSGKLL